MSDFLQHECGIAMLRLKKPLQHYVDKYGTPFYGLNKMYLLMEKQHNRGQDGAGLANIKLDVNPGKRYISRMRSVDARPIQDLFGKIMGRFQDLSAEQLQDTVSLQHDHAFTGELFLGHLRYGTFGKNEIENCHPFLRQNNWRTRNLVVAGNFNLTNVDELFDVLVQIGQHPKQKSDTVTVLEKLATSWTRPTKSCSTNSRAKVWTTKPSPSASRTPSTWGPSSVALPPTSTAGTSCAACWDTAMPS